MRSLLLIISVVLLGACAMPPAATQTAGPAQAPTVAPTASPDAATAGWESYQDAETGWSFAYPPGSVFGRDSLEPPWYSLVVPAVDFPDGNVVSFGADSYDLPAGLSLEQWVEMRYAVGEWRDLVTAFQWVTLDDEEADRRGLMLETPTVGEPSYTFYLVHGNQVIKLMGPGTAEMAHFLPMLASTMQISDAASATLEDKPSLVDDYQAVRAAHEAAQSATPALDIVARDATAAAQLTPGPQATYSPEMQTQEAAYYQSLETATAVAFLAPPTPTQPPTPTATPIPAGRPDYALYQGSGSYTDQPRLQVVYDMTQWVVSISDRSQLVNRQLANCVLDLQGGAREMLGPAVIEWITLGGYRWVRTDWRGDHVIGYFAGDGYGSDMDNFIIQLRYAAEASREDVAACRSTAETVLDTFKVLD